MQENYLCKGISVTWEISLMSHSEIQLGNFFCFSNFLFRICNIYILILF